MSNIGDDISAGSLIGMILGIPIFFGIAILAIPFVIISGFTGVPMHILIQNLLVFAAAVFFVWLFSRLQIIENGIVGLIVGSLAHTYLQWHSVACILIGVAVAGFLFFISYIHIGFWIKTILFSSVVTLIVFVVLYSDAGLFPLPDMIWKVAFAVIFFLENIFIRCSVAYDRGFLFEEYGNHKKEGYHYDVRQAGSVAAQPGYNENEANSSTLAEINNLVRKMNAEILENREKEISTTKIEMPEEQEKEEISTYLMDRVYLFSQKRSFWDGRSVTDNMEEKAYSILKDFLDKDYLILPHVSFREIFWWGDWKNDQKLTDRVTKMHFDFGIYNKDLQPILFIEIQGKDHKENPKVIERDKFKLEVMNRCGMKLIAIDCSEPMTDSEIREKIIARIKKEIPDRKACAAYCPNCKSHGKNSLMKIKPNKNGTYFYGCSTYEKNKQDNCPGVSIEDVPSLYWGIPLFKVEKEN